MVVVVLACISGAQAQVLIDTETVGNTANADDTEGDGYGGVDCVYNIGTFEVTAGQYTESLNAVAEAERRNPVAARDRLAAASDAWPVGLQEAEFLATFDEGNLWFESRAELDRLGEEAERLISANP